MADENLKDFSISWVLVGLLFTCLLTFAITFMDNNNPNGLGDDMDYILNKSQSDINSQLYLVDDDANEILNVTSQTNPETSFLGGRDSVSTSYSLRKTGVSNWEKLKIFVAWVFIGDIGKLLISVIGGILGLVSIYFITKLIRQGT